MDKHNW